MSFLYPALGASVVVAGGDKLVGERAYDRMFKDLGWSPSQMRGIAAAEVVGGLLMIPRATRRLGGMLVAGASAAVLASEARSGAAGLGAARALVLLCGLCALVAPGD